VKAEGYLTDLINRHAVDFIRRQGKQPFFLYVPHLAVHWPFHAPDRPEQKLTEANKYDGTRADYATMLQRVDRGVGEMLAELEKQGVLDNTLLIFSSDNGGERFSNNLPLFHHKSSLWEGGIRVPCLMRWPAKLPQGKKSSQVGITMDLTATILSAANVKPPADRPLDGIDLLPIISGDKAGQDRTLFWRVNRTGQKQKAARHGHWKYIQDGMVEMLYNLKDDISERRDLGYRHPDVLARLKQLHADWEAELAKNTPGFVVR
jgi:arylsulfatase A-like enzyme